MYKTITEEKCGICSELRRAAIAAVSSTHQAFLLVLEAINSVDDSSVDVLMAAAKEQSDAKMEIVNAYMDHLQTHCDDSDELESWLLDA